ncbi:MAG: redoxin domain-containing protein [Burkholderiales bacterium]|nr:MAG: redoxin domain-containing protein [Burkholderiales bacterium]
MTRPLARLLALSATAALTVAFYAQASAQATPAPEFAGIGRWFNSPPLRMEQLRGKVVLVDFWTRDCINCLHTLSHVQHWHTAYKDKGLVVVGVHTPELDAERPAEAVAQAIQRYGLSYPVAQDNDYKTWSAWHNAYWPALYLVDKQGHVVFSHIGEGDYERIEEAIQAALR